MSTDLYEKGLGFPRMESPPDTAFFTLNDTWLDLSGRETLAEDAQVSAAGATLVKKPQKVFWGGYSGYFKDPDGHLWEVVNNPFFWAGPSDQ